MRRNSRLLAVMLLVGAAPAPVRTYDCIADGAAVAQQMRFGAGEYSTFDPATGQWSVNQCAEAKDCRVNGAMFSAAFGPNFFSFNQATGKYVMMDLFGDVIGRGKCVPK